MKNVRQIFEINRIDPAEAIEERKKLKKRIVRRFQGHYKLVPDWQRVQIIDDYLKSNKRSLRKVLIFIYFTQIAESHGVSFYSVKYIVSTYKKYNRIARKKQIGRQKKNSQNIKKIIYSNNKLYIIFL